MARVQIIIEESGQPMDLATVKAWDGEFQGLTPGDYLFQVEEASQEASKTKGTPQLVVKCLVIQGFTTETHNGNKITHWVALTAKAAGRLKNFLDATGLVPDADGGFDDQDLVGRYFIAEAFDQEYTKVDGQGVETKTVSTKLKKERPYGETAAEPPAAPPPAVQPAPPPPAQPAPPPPPPAQPAPPPAAPTRAQAPQLPRAAVATHLLRPGQRLPVPNKK
jgi:hypothetical protein